MKALNHEAADGDAAVKTVLFSAPPERSSGDPVPEDLSDLTVAELRARAKEACVAGYSTMNKADLICALEEL